MNRIQAYVTKSDSDFVRLKILDARIKEKIINIGLTNDIAINEYIIITPDDRKKASVLNQLRNIGVCFSDGREWCPAEIFEHLRDKGLLAGTFSMVSWTTPDEYFITTEK